MFDSYDLHYAADLEYWVKYFSTHDIDNLSKRWTCNDIAAHVYGINHVSVVQQDVFSKQNNCVSSGGNSAFQAFNLCLHFGVKEFYLFGLDMGGGHFFGERSGDFKSANKTDYERWAINFNFAIEQYQEELKVYNCSAPSLLRGMKCERFV